MGVQGSKMVRLAPKQLEEKVGFIRNYIKALNAAEGSIFDANSNVTSKNIATLEAELNKDINIQVMRALVVKQINRRFGKKLGKKYLEQLEKHEIYAHDEAAGIKPYCAAVSIYPFLQNGLQDFGGEAKAPKHLSSFNGGFVNLIFALSSQFRGAVATVEYLMCFDHYAKLDYGEDYLVTHTKVIEQELQQVVYALNQPASARGNQCPFWNVSIFDRNYFDALFSYFTFPDGSKTNYESVNKLQKFFMHWFNQERKKALLTFPVVTAALLHDNTEPVDKDFADFITKELSEGNSFFIYNANTVDALSSCCRLRNSIADQLNDFQYSLGAGGVMTGSLNVITLNMSRFIQNVFNRKKTKKLGYLKTKLEEQVALIHKYQLGVRNLFVEMQKAGMFPAYDANYIAIDKQYLTVGINGLLEGLEFLGISPVDKPDIFKAWVSEILKTISETNKKSSNHYHIKLNTEFVPAENLGVKFAKWDKKDRYYVPRPCYNSYLYPVEDERVSVIQKFFLHGDETSKYLDGGSAYHCNLEDIPTQETFKKLLNIAIKSGCSYFCFNTKVTICNDCKHIDKQTNDHCVKCGSKNIDYATRVIGYLRRVSNFSKARQEEEHRRCYHKC